MNQLRIVAWEITKKCNLSCIHCRGRSDISSDSGFSKKECFEIIDQIKETGNPVVILTGGEPLLRDDIFEIARYGSLSGLKIVLATNGTLIDEKIAERIKESGIKRVSVSIDSLDEKKHDEFRNTEGAFRRALNGINILRKNGIEFQINTTVTKDNVDEIEKMIDMAVKIGAAAHHLFFLVPTGRARSLKDKQIDKERYERLLFFLYKKKDSVPIHIKPTCAPQYYRLIREKRGNGFEQMTRGCICGISFCFISAEGIVQPCGYLELKAGDLKEEKFKEIWENSEIFNKLRDFSLYKGKCGSCEYVKVCGGCRARAYEEKGDFLEEEPLCLYKPKRWTK